jgi:hypothetical protein
VSLRGSFLLLLPLLALGAHGAEPPPFTLPTEQRYAGHLELAAERIAVKDWAVATTLLQKVLDLPWDRFAIVRRLEPAGKDGQIRVRTPVLVSLREEAERLLGSLPPEGRQFYEQEYGVEAAALLRQGRMFNEPRSAPCRARQSPRSDDSALAKGGKRSGDSSEDRYIFSIFRLHLIKRARQKPHNLSFFRQDERSISTEPMARFGASGETTALQEWHHDPPSFPAV